MEQTLNQKKKSVLEEQAVNIIGTEQDPKRYVRKQDVLDIVDKIIKSSSALLAYPTIRSAEARAMLNGVKDEVKKL